MKTVKPYEVLSGFYSELMADIDYDIWAEYLSDLLASFSLYPKRVLEIASGNGRLSAFLAKKIEAGIILTDLSYEMLSQAEVDFPKVACDMRELPFAAKFDFIFSAFDSVNYLLNEEDLLKFFNAVSDVLDENGLFMFDISLEQNSIDNVDLFNRTGKAGDYDFEQISVYDKTTRIHSNEFIITYDNRTFYEKHRQRIYPFFDYFSFLEKAGLFVVACYDAFTFDDATPESRRAQFIVRKIK